AVTITVSHATQAITVPTSAVRTVGGGGLHVVTVLSGGKTSAVPVRTGAVGSDVTEILSGLQEGQEVVLADMSQALPSANTNTNSNTRGRGRGLGGGGLGGGGRFGGATLGR